MTVEVVHDEVDVPDKMVDGKPTLVYWNIVGLALPIRLALVYAGVDFEDVRIEAGDPTSPDFNKAYPTAKAGKLSKIMPFPNLPYFLDENNVNIAQTNTILRHVARKYGVTSTREHMTDMYCDHLTDLEVVMVRLMYLKSADAVFNWYKSSAPATLSKFSEMIKSEGKQFLTGDKPRVDDFKLFTFLHKMRVIQEDLGTNETKSILTDDLVAYMKRIEDLPKVKEYLASSDHLAKPLNNPNAKWIGK